MYKNVLPLIEKRQLRSALWKVKKYILASQTITDLEGEHPRLKKQPRVNWLFRVLSEESEAGSTKKKNYSYPT